ncbi:MAG TPA: right-handed parallel beta-helix repeat-containing protein, partial [Candidatus Saccharimonadales bacterium]|nr:right-handed parallel beta-helix repeat-containing protein [Candidatus Saccharimonadales bacterium]
MSAFLAAFLLAISSLATTISPFVEQAFAAGGETLYVNTNSGDDRHTCKVEVEPCRTIGKAIENANPGDTIVVASGNYEEALSIDKSVSIIGAGQGSTTIKAPASFSNNGDLISISGSSVSVDMSDLSIDGVSSSYASNGAGIHVYGSANANLNEVTVDGVRNDPATKKYLYGVLVGSRDSSTAGTATITNSTVSDYQRGGIYVSGAGSFATITNNTVQAGTGLPGLLNGIVVEFGANADIEGNTVKGNWYPGSNWSGSGIGIWDQATDATIVKNNTVTDNQVGVGIVTDNPAVLKNLDVSDVTGNETNARVDSVYYDSWGYWHWASPDTTYVDSSNTTDDYGVVMVDGHAVVKGYDLFDNLSDAIDAVKTGGTVELDSNTTVTHQVTVNKSLTLDGNNHTITAQAGTYTNG